MHALTSSDITKEEGYAIRSMLEYYLGRSEGIGAAECNISRLAGGMNNSTYLIQCGEQRYVLRNYNSHQDTEKVQYEHAILKSLATYQKSFVIPQLVHTIEDETFVNHEGKIGALFHYQNGCNPELIETGQYFDLGQKAGQLSIALSNIKVPLCPVYPPYYKIELAYTECSPADFVRFLREPDPLFLYLQEETKEIAGEVEQLFIKISQLEQLPHQVVHGDLNASNILVSEEGEITTILDFEFATWDIRVMELAVPLSDIISGMISDETHTVEAEEKMWSHLEALIRGYRSGVHLLKEEMDILPSLLLLRRVDVVMHFLSRYKKGIDGADVVKAQLQELVHCVRWQEKNRTRLEHLL
ncbi:phosphotransferase [Paenibacillus sp. Marseille-Q4541]|uniref:phosphotransferase n=1 Tax=Paenibacillus sp. Marseille-Q4541 TaxID=2831522 RepID=UPI001BAA16E7|nr:phosphotransferase [Paenibacillus sp. Marseille-Q4541]